jgi:hypothetical protein
MTLVGLLREKLGIQKALTTEYDPEFKNRMNTLRGAEGTTKGTTGFDKYFGPRAETHTDHPVSGRAMRKAVASVNAYWGIYGIYREGFYQADNDRLARNPILAICEKGIMDYLGIVEWEVIDHEENRVEKAVEFLKRPNPQDTFPTLLKMTARDMIRYDAGAWVKTLSEPDNAGRQVLLEFKAYSGPEFWIEIDRDWRGVLGEQGLVYEGPYSLGYVKRYWQHAKAGVFIPFDPKEVVYFCCYPRADSCYGTDFMQQLKWYLEYLIDSTKAAGMTFANGIMPGMKYKHPQYTSVAQLIEANAELGSANLGPENFNGIVNLIGEEDIEPLTPTMVDMQWLEGQEWVAKIVWAMFGFSSSEFVGDDVNRATAYVARNITKSRMLSPLLRKFEEMVNENILPDIEGWNPGWRFKFKDVVDLDDELKQSQIDQSRATAAQTYMQMGVPLEAALRIVGVEEEKIERAVRALEEAQEDAWNQGMEGGGGPMGPPGLGGGLNTNPQGEQPLSPEEAAQYYAEGEDLGGPQVYNRDNYGSASSQDHEGSDEDVKKAGPPDDDGEDEDHPDYGRVRKLKIGHPEDDRTYAQPGKVPKGAKLYRGPRGGVYYLSREAPKVKKPEPMKYVDLSKEAKPQDARILPSRPRSFSEGAQGAAPYPPREEDRPGNEVRRRQNRPAEVYPVRPGRVPSGPAQGAGPHESKWDLRKKVAAIAKSEVDDEILKAEPIYLKPGEEPPEGVKVYEGKRGGRFYLERSRQATPLQTPARSGGNTPLPKREGADTRKPNLGGPGAEQETEDESTQEEGKQGKEYTEEERDRILRKYAKREPGKGIETEIADEDELGLILSHTKFGLISAGPNDDEKGLNPIDFDQERYRKRHEELRQALKEKGYVFTQVLGRYGDFEDSFLVMTHDAERDDLVELGKRMNQSSVIFCDHGQNELITTRGDKIGSAVTGEGFSWVPPDADENFTAVYLEGRNGTVNFALNFNWDKEHTEDVKKEAEEKKPEYTIDPEKVKQHAETLYDEGRDRVDKNYHAIKKSIVRNGGSFRGLEYRLKTRESIHRSLLREHKRHPHLPEDKLLDHVDDVCRFTCILSPYTYQETLIKTLDDLTSSGVEVVKVSNFWRRGKGCYKGVNAKLRIDGKPVELQFHTPETYDIKQNKTHKYFEIARSLTATKDQKDEAKARIKEIYRSCKYPPRIENWHWDNSKS